MRRALTGLLALLALAACSSGPPAEPQERTARAVVTTAPSPVSVASKATPGSPLTPYQEAVDAAAQRGLQVWLETDLAKFWLQGRSQFDTAIKGLGALAVRPGVVGIKIADELGYKDGFDRSPTRVRAFLRDAARALGRHAPRRRILVDFVVPELGCVPNVPVAAGPAAQCRAEARARFPALTLEAMDGYLASGHLDVVDLSTGMLDDSVYRSWKIDQVQAQRAAWREIARRGWLARVLVQARKALAHPGAYPHTVAAAAHDLNVFVDIPRQLGAEGVDVWTWRQTYQQQVVRLMDPGLQPNPLWNGLRARGRDAVLFTHFTPSSVERGLHEDMEMLSEVFSGVFVAAGLG